MSTVCYVSTVLLVRKKWHNYFFSTLEVMTEKQTSTETSYSQCAQDLFVLKTLDYKRNGTFLEIGSHQPIYINNTYLLETKYNWKGVMVEIDDTWEEHYKKYRPNSEYILQDAVKIDYEKALENYPRDMDYLQIDLFVDDMSTLNTLLKLNDTVLKSHRFAVITFKHDHYTGDRFRTRDLSRVVLKDLGYRLVFPDVNMFEDWWVHPDLVNRAILDHPMNLFVRHENAISFIEQFLPTK